MSVFERYEALPPLLVVAVLGAVLGILQASSGDRFYLYQRTYESFAVGLFSNRNHNAASLAMALPMLRVWTLMVPHGAIRRRRLTIAAGCGVLILPTILLTGSRAGMGLALFAMLAAMFIEPRHASSSTAEQRRSVAIRLSIVVGLGVLVAVVALAGRATSLERLAAVQDFGAELRTRAMPVMISITRDFFPYGSGFGSFDAVFRMYEPDALLAPGYFNHAHNDLVEVALTGGLPAVAILTMFGGVMVRSAIQLRQTAGAEPADVLYLRLAIVMWAIMGVASLFDYPLRSPLMMVIMTCATLWATGASANLALARQARRRDQVA